jgi:hypothetical protein
MRKRSKNVLKKPGHRRGFYKWKKVSMRQHTSTYVNIRQYTTTSVSRRQQKGTYSTPSRLSWMENKARMLTYVDVCWCMLTYVDVCIGEQVAEVTELSNTVTLCPCTEKIKNLHMLYSLSFCRKWRVIVCHDSRPRWLKLNIILT